MATTELDAPAIALTTPPAYTVSAGSNRRAYVLAIHCHGSNAAPATGMTLGGQAGTVVTTVDDDVNTFDVCATLFEWREASIALMSGSTMTPAGGTYSNRAWIYWSVQGADQGDVTPVTSAVSGTSGSISLTRVADSWTFAATVQDFAGTAFSGLANPAEANEANVSDIDVAYGYGTDTERTANFTWTHSTSRNNVTFAVNIAPADSGATISDGSPSGTIATQRRVTLGATSTASTGTFYGVISATEADITGITAAQVYAGQYAGGGAATFSANAAVTDSTPSVEITGLSPATTYHYAVMHRVGTDNSNVVTGSFTTAVATSTATLTLRDSGGALLNAQTLNFWTRTGLNTVAADGGSGGLSVTCDASGVFTFTGLTVDAGAGFLTVQNPSDNTYSANYPVTFVAGV